MQLYLAKRENGIYYIWYTDETGRRKKVSTGCCLKVEAIRFLQDFRASEYKKKSNLQFKSLRSFSDEFLEYSRTVHTRKTQEAFKTAFSELIRVVGDLPLQRVGVREIEFFLAKKKEEASEWTARKYYIAVASAFETAKRWNYLLSNPFRLVEKPKVAEALPVYCTKEEFAALLATIEDSDFKELCICAVSTGLRLGELTNLRWAHLDFDREVVLVQNSEIFTTKNRRIRAVPMTEHLQRLMSSRKQRSTCDLVFHRSGQGLTKDYVSKTFKKYVIKAKINEAIHFHSLRHAFATWLVQAGVSIYEVQKLLGHSSITVTQVYTHLQPQQLHEAVNRLNLLPG